MQSLIDKNVLVLGIGNTLLSDEGFGPAAIFYLESNFHWPKNITLLDGSTLGLMLMPELLECDFAIILDIALGGNAPGTFYQFGGNELNNVLSAKYSMHQTNFNDVLINCDLVGHRPETIFFAMEPFDFHTFSPQITSSAADRLPSFCKNVINFLQDSGLAISKLSSDAI